MSRTPRPKTLDEFIGQAELKQRLSIALDAARARGRPLPHTLLAGPPGLGKTTLARVLANEMGTSLHVVSAATVTRADELRRSIARVQYGDVYFLDEIHALARDIEETLYPVAEDFRLEVVSLDGTAKRLRVPEFTIVGATTRRGQVSAPMRDRFLLIEALTFYEPDELATIATRAAEAYEVELTGDAARIIGERSRGTPRIANRLAARVADWAHAYGMSSMGALNVDAALNDWGIDDAGLDPLDRAVLNVLEHTFDGGPVGVQTLALAIGEDQATIADAVEPYLTRLGLMAQTPRGRVITERGRAHMTAPMGDEFNEADAAAYEAGLAEGAPWAEAAYAERESARSRDGEATVSHNHSDEFNSDPLEAAVKAAATLTPEQLAEAGREAIELNEGEAMV